MEIGFISGERKVAPMTDLPDGYVAHPAADLFPLLTGDALKALTADIKTNGLQHPIVLDADGLVIDGRNRLIACKAAGVEPTITTTEIDAFDLVVSMNVKRRMLNKSQLAVLAAKALPVYREEARRRQTSGKKLPNLMPKGKATTLVGRAFGVSGEYVRQAEIVLKRRPELADEILNLSPVVRDSMDSMTSLWRAHQDATAPEREERREEIWRENNERREKEREERDKKQEEFKDALEAATLAFGTSDDIRAQVEAGTMTFDEARNEHFDRKQTLQMIMMWVQTLEPVLEEAWLKSDSDMLKLADALNSAVGPHSREATVGQLTSCSRLLSSLVEEWRRLL